MEYLRKLYDLVKTNPSQIKQLIQDLPKLKDHLLFSKLREREDRDRLCFLLDLLMKRVMVSSRRSKQAFTSMWDTIRVCLETILNDGLKINSKDENVNIILRKILQMNIPPTTKNIDCHCDWLAMDLDTQLKQVTFSQLRAFQTSDEQDIKTLYLYCNEFTVPDFPIVFLELAIVNADLIDLFFSPKYFNVMTVSKYIETKECIPYEFISNLRNVTSTIWLDFSCETIIILVNKLKTRIYPNNKEVSAIFELFEVISTSLDYRNTDTDTDTLKSLLADMVNVDVSEMSDALQSKFWCFVSALLSCECLSLTKIDLEYKIVNSLESGKVKAMISLCRVISLYWPRILDQGLIVSRLLNSITRHENNKLRWNIAVTLMNYNNAEQEDYLSIKEFLMEEMDKFGNFKVILSFTKLLQKWSNDDNLLDSDGVEIVWSFLNRLKLFINSNSGSLECEDGEGLMETAMKLENVLKSILIGGFGDGIKFELE